MKRSKVTLLLTLLLVLTLVAVSCAQKPAETPAPAPETPAAEGYKDGVYKAEQADFSETGWKDFVEVTVEGGKITAVNWDATNKDDETLMKKKASQDGVYDMKVAGAQSDWHEQAALVEQYLIEQQDPTKIEYSDEEGHVDTITGVSINVKGFFELAAQALEQAK
jgi:major membrane immunogen (membrane-anchored lipoprotein)